MMLFSLTLISVVCCFLSNCDGQRDAENLQKSLKEHGHKLEKRNSDGSVIDALKLHDQKLQAINKTLSSAIDQISEKLNEELWDATIRDFCPITSAVCDCSDIKANGYIMSGVYRISVDDANKRHYANAFCDMKTTKGGWTVFQKRKDGSAQFYREWNDYENGFGNPNGEFWLGNKFLNLLTSKRSYHLRIDLEDFKGEKRFAEYSTFNISSSADSYRLNIGNYSGTAGDSLLVHNKQRFSTKDKDYDGKSKGNCAVERHGAWWYKNCTDSNLNGLYLRGNYSSNGSLNGWEGITWKTWYERWYSLKTTEMKISSV